MLVAAPTSQKLVVAVVTTILVRSMKLLVEKLPLAPVPGVTWTMLVIPVVFHVINRSLALVRTIDVIWKGRTGSGTAIIIISPLYGSSGLRMPETSARFVI